jgi:hypothetical protein
MFLFDNHNKNSEGQQTECQGSRLYVITANPTFSIEGLVITWPHSIWFRINPFQLSLANSRLPTLACQLSLANFRLRSHGNRLGNVCPNRFVNISQLRCNALIECASILPKYPTPRQLHQHRLSLRLLGHQINCIRDTPTFWALQWDKPTDMGQTGRLRRQVRCFLFTRKIQSHQLQNMLKKSTRANHN